MTLNHFQQNKRKYEIIFLCCYFFINATLLATSVIMEAQRSNTPLPFDVWEPFVWEYSSAISSLFLFPFIVYLLTKNPFNWQAIKRSLLYYFIASIVFSACHVLLMVLMRKGVYFFFTREYDFGDIWFEMIYEYRKDLWSFIFFVIVIKGYQFIISRLQGEANPIGQGEDDKPPSSIDRLLVKKLGKEFIIRIEDVEWLESAGNYVNLHIGERIYPLRATLTSLVAQLDDKGFCRIHRSYAIKLDMVDSINSLSSGDSEVKLRNGKVLMLSRRYKESFKETLK
ncbi:LytR/AlgR family response regulator transcription factor [Thalassotalea atypica]|uniref:LytR/AlgR family response regulator transcription factor n=1 Tax=Thalassotalea atypica TaxID=2054316 RepID=UPI0025725399|nr:LytTR family DNA-binding domain-containing protein [Thalassotalea atypica]